MSKCILCGNELLTGDIHWESGMCNTCWKNHYAVKGAVPLDEFYGDLYLNLLKDYRKLEQELEVYKEALNSKLKFKHHQKVFVIIDNEIFEGQIDAYDVYTQKYLVFIGTDDIDDLGLGNEWIDEDSIFTTKKQAKESMK